MSDRISPSREFRNIFSYLFRHEADMRTSIPVAGVMRMGWGWAFIIDDFFRIYSEYARINPETGQLELTEESQEKVMEDLQSEDGERRYKAQLFIRWLTVLDKQLPLLLNMSPRSHEVAAALVRSVTMPQVRYTVTEASQYRPPFWARRWRSYPGRPDRLQRKAEKVEGRGGQSRRASSAEEAKGNMITREDAKAEGAMSMLADPLLFLALVIALLLRPSLL